MGRRQRGGHFVPQPCPVHGKSVHHSAGSARAAATEVERREGLERGAMDAYYCADSKGWHIGHRSIRSRLERDDH